MLQVLFEVPVPWIVYAVLAIGVLVSSTGVALKRRGVILFGAVLFAAALTVRLAFWEPLSARKPFQVFGFGSVLFVAFVAASWLVQRLARRDGLDADAIVDMALWIFLVGIVGARLLFMALHPDEFDGPLDFFKIWRGGLVFYGGVVGGIAVFVWYAQRFKLPVWRVLDVLAPTIALGIGIGRFGCLLNGCCWGRPTELPWAITFPARSIPWEAQVHAGLINEGAARSLAVHPTQIYMALAGWVLLAITLAFFPRRRHHGEVMVVMMIGYAISRFLIEMLRDDDKLLGEKVTISQIISVVLLVGGIAMWAWLRRGPAITPRAAAEV